MIRDLFSLLKEYLILLWINLSSKISNFIEYMHVVIRYYRHTHFAKIDLALLFSYLFSNPFHVSKNFLIQKGEKDPYTYGETPLTTLELIARNCKITSQNVVFELGCGRGRTCFWLNQLIGCTVVGIDYTPIFIEKAQKIKELFQVQKVYFRLEDFLQTNLNGVEVIYLYGTCLSTEKIHLLIDRFSQLPRGTKIITISYALTEFQPSAPFKVIKQFPASFTWGQADVYLQVKKRV